MNRLLTAALLLIISSAAADDLVIKFKSTSSGGHYRPKNVLAVWVTDSSGSFVDSAAVWANKRKGALAKWKSASGQYVDADANMGATRSSHSSLMTATWDLKNKAGSIVPNGVYTIHLEDTESNSGSPSDYTTFTFNKNGVAQSQSLPNAGGFTTISYVYSVSVPNTAPVVDAGTNQTVTLPANASLDATVTDDGQPSGSTVTQTWTKQSGPGTVTFGNASNVDTTASFSTAGTYVLKLTATDTDLSSSDTVTITVNPANAAPVVDAGTNQSIVLPSNATLDGTVTDDGLPSGSTVTQTWTKQSGPGTVTFGDATAVDTTASFSAAGTYVLKLTATDTDKSSSDTVTITVDPVNTAPVVDAGANQAITLPANATLDATVTDDGYPSAGTLTQTWTKQSGPGTVTFGNASNVDTTASFSAAGTYVLKLTASDGALSTSDTVTITVNPQPNIAPVVDAGANQSIALPAGATLDGTVTDDGLPSGSTVTQTWTKQSGPGTVTFGDATAVDTTASFSAAGTYVLKLTATDTDKSTSDTVTITVDPVNTAPVVDAGANQTITPPVVQVNLDATVTDDGYPSGGALTQTWTKQSGPGTVTFGDATAVDTTATFSTAGTYVLKLTATDGALSTSDTVTITVEVGNFAPVVDAGANQSIALPAGATLDGTVTDDGLPSGSTVTQTWTKQSGPGTVTFGDATAVDTTASFSAAGTYVLKLTATDTDLSASDTVTITVDPANTAPVVDAGVNQTITLPAMANLDGTVTDDGLPSGSTVTQAWTKQSGPGTVTFGDATAVDTTASFSAAGTYVLKLTATDTDKSTSDTVTLTVNGIPNTAPTIDSIWATPTTVRLPAGVTVSVIASDGDGDPLTYAWTQFSGPGTATFAAPTSSSSGVTFSTTGVYVLRVTVSDGNGGVVTGDVTVTATSAATNKTPVANDQSVSTSEDTPRTITLIASDGDGDPLTYSLVDWPSHGNASIAGNVVTYTPSLNFNGGDSFTFKANDGLVDSNTATVSITVSGTNDPPIAHADTIDVEYNHTKVFSLSATDPEGAVITYSIVALPQHGIATLNGSEVTYTPDSNYGTRDFLTFRASDGSLSDDAEITFRIGRNSLFEGCGMTGDSGAISWLPLLLLVVVLLAVRRIQTYQQLR